MKKLTKFAFIMMLALPIAIIGGCKEKEYFNIQVKTSNDTGVVSGAGRGESYLEGTKLTLKAPKPEKFLAWIKDNERVVDTSESGEYTFTVNSKTQGTYTALMEENEYSQMQYATVREIALTTADSVPQDAVISEVTYKIFYRSTASTKVEKNFGEVQVAMKDNVSLENAKIFDAEKCPSVFSFYDKLSEKSYLFRVEINYTVFGNKRVTQVADMIVRDTATLDDMGIDFVKQDVVLNLSSSMAEEEKIEVRYTLNLTIGKLTREYFQSKESA